ncbi:unnamed protein product [Ascophyllum nodosum]
MRSSSHAQLLITKNRLCPLLCERVCWRENTLRYNITPYQGGINHTDQM